MSEQLKPVLEFAKLFAIKHCHDAESVKLIHMIDAYRAENTRPTPDVACSTVLTYSAPVEVCPDCDIIGCQHIRNRTGAFAPTPDVAGDVVDENVLARGINAMHVYYGDQPDDISWGDDARHDRNALHAALSALCNTRSEPQGKALPSEDEAVEIMMKGYDPDGVYENAPIHKIRMYGAYRALLAATPQSQPVTRDELVEVLIKGNRPDNWWRTLMQPVADDFLSQFNVTRK